jgi:hypothetical protein
MNPEFAAKLRGILAEADAAFAKSGDPMDALGWIALAAKAGAPLPPRMGQWLHKALQEYIASDDTMDAAMGLDKRGQAQPRRRRRSDVELNDTLGRMWFLIKAGADRTQAAVLVAALTGRSVEQLQRSYGSSWFVRRTDDPFEGVPPTSVREYVVGMLAEYPDGAETEQEKTAILARHPAPPAAF